MGGGSSLPENGMSQTQIPTDFQTLNSTKERHKLVAKSCCSLRSNNSPGSDSLKGKVTSLLSKVRYRSVTLSPQNGCVQIKIKKNGRTTTICFNYRPALRLNARPHISFARTKNWGEKEKKDGNQTASECVLFNFFC